MRLRGLDALELSLTLALVLAALLLLYWLRRPARRVVVPALALWASVLPEQRRVTAVLSRVRGLLSLVLALVIAAGLVFALSDPERDDGGQARSLVLLLDVSASMAARDDGVSRLELAKQRARAAIRALGPRDRALLIGFDATPTPHTTWTDDRALLLAALERTRASDRVSDLLRATELALALIEKTPHAELVLYSDGAHADARAVRDLLARQPRVVARHERVGERANNLAITRFAVRRYPLDKAHHESLISLANFGDQPEALTLEIRSGGRLLFQEALTLAARGEHTRTLSDLPGASSLLEARILPARGSDALALDDRASARLPARKRTRVLLVTRGDRYLEAALLLDDELDVTELAPDQYRDARGYDVVVFDGTLPQTAPRVPALYLGPLGTSGHSPLAIIGALERPFFERVRETHSLVRQLSLEDVNIARAAALELARGDVAIGATQAQKPLLVAGSRDGVPFILLAFALRESDLPLRAAFPLLMLRALDQLTTPGGVARDELAIASHVAASESDLVQRERVFSAGPVEQKRAPQSSLFSGRVWPLLALSALCLLALEWLTFHRRWTL
jgi:hypothetical protein